MITLKNIFFNYKDLQIYEDLHFTIAENKLIGIFGRNGVGKTSLLKLILGIVRPTSGEIHYDFSQTPLLQSFGALIENPPIIDYMTVFENLNYKRLFLGLDVDCVEEALKNCQLAGYKHVKAQNLSLGNKQKLGIALAILNKPRVLLLDEPTNSIDEETSKEIMDVIVNFRKIEGCSVIIISHDRNLLTTYCDEFYEIENHKVICKV